MNEKKESTDLLEQRLSTLKSEQIHTILEEIDRRFSSSEMAYAQSCVHCGLCADACHYYLTNGEPQDMPVYKLNLILSVYKKHFTTAGKVLSSWIGAQELTPAMVREWVDCLYGRCSGCARCTIACTSGINISSMIRSARGALTAAGLVPPDLQSTITTAVESGNNMAIPREEWIDTIQWIEEELQAETGDPDARIPIDKHGARFLYAVNPREPKFFPLSLLAAAKIFHAAGESWTFSSDYYDLTNYGLYSGDDQVAGMLSERLILAMEQLRTGTLVLGECGHGYNANRWEAPQWLDRQYEFPVLSILEVLSDYVRKGTIRLDPARNTKPVTLHDPCNLVRMGGLSEPQRFLLARATRNFVEMTPNRQKNYCCGGGGGQLAMSRYAKRRLKAGKIKADQISTTGAKVVAAPCHNCIDQLQELNKEYKLGVEVKTVTEIVADALICGK